MSAAVAGFVAGSATALAVLELGSAVFGVLTVRGPSWLRALAALVEALVRAGREGRDPGALERRRLLIGGACVAFAAGFVTLASPAPSF